MVVHWGIVSAGKISHDFCNALNTVMTENRHKVIGVAAKDLNRAKEFATKHAIPNAYGTYEELFKNSQVKIVYIGATNNQHYDLVTSALQNGKHVLCEKPLTLNGRDTEKLIALAKKQKLFFMEAIWSRCFPLIERVQQEMKAGTIGEVIQVEVNFGFPLESVDRISNPQLGGGVTLDLGVYTLQFVTMAMGGDRPEKLVATGHCNEEGSDIAVVAALKYSNERTAIISMSGKTQLSNEGVIRGTKGTIRVPSFWCPDKIIIPNETLEFPLPTGAKYPFNFLNSEGLAYEAEEVRRCLEYGYLESSKVPHSLTQLMADLEEDIRKQLGAKFLDN